GFQHIRSVTVFGWSESHPGDAVYEAAREVARLLAGYGLTIVSGGFGGEMEAAARGAKEGGGKAIGVTFYPKLATEFEAGREASRYLDQEIRTRTYLERTLKLIALGDAFLCFNGGTGTISEWGMAWGLARIYYGHHKPLIMYGGFWKDIVAVIERDMHIRPEEKKVYRIVDSPREAVRALKHFDLKHKGFHPHYALTRPEGDFILQH
ncbi:MAG TPA: LOG family protein, partial [Terrimicrobiaceae bacterium]|nr:LOG family protein [Terrimicrobiaceae bacterium]